MKKTLDHDLQQKIKTDKLIGNAASVEHSIAFHQKVANQLLPQLRGVDRAQTLVATQLDHAEKTYREQWLKNWQTKIWPDALSPQLVEQWQVLEKISQPDLDLAKIGGKQGDKKKMVLQAREELTRRQKANDLALSDESGIKSLHRAINKILEQEKLYESQVLNKFNNEQDDFWMRWTNEHMPPYANHNLMIQDQDSNETENDEGCDVDFDDIVYDYKSGQNLTRNTLQTLSQIEMLNPLFIKNSAHLTPEEQSTYEYYIGQRQRRIQQIQSRCNFFEINRNKKLFSKHQYHELLKESLAKTSSTELPPEFRGYVTALQTYQAQSPGKFFMAQKYGRVVPGSSERDRMERKDYQKFFAAEAGKLPEGLETALARYRERVTKEQSGKNPKVQELMDYLKERNQSKKPMDMAEIDQIVGRIRDMEDAEERMSLDQIWGSADAGAGALAQRRQEQSSQAVSLASEVIAQNQSQIVQKKVTKLTESQFNARHAEARAYLANKSPDFEQLCSQLNLDDSQAFAAFITDVFVNSSVSLTSDSETVTSCLLLDRFTSLLSQLAGNQTDIGASVNELCQTYEGDASDLQKQHVYFSLARDSSFMLKFTVLQIAKQHNLYGQVDNYMRSFAKICVGLPDGGDIAKKLEGVLNSEVAITDSQQVFKPKDRKQEDYQTVDPGLIAQPDFQFLPAGMRIARIEEYHRMRQELQKTKDLREMLQQADQRDGAQMQRSLMQSPKTLESILEHLDADPKTTKEHGKFADLWYLDRYMKVSGSIDSLVSRILGEDFGHENISWDNIEQVYNPLLSGVDSIEEQRQSLVTAGMSIEQADQLKRQYIQKVARASSKHTLMDFFSDGLAKRNLHEPSLDMQQICMNYEPPTCNMNLRKGLRAVQELSGRIAPIRPMSMASARQFSTSNIQTSDSESDAEEEGQKKGRFFKFLEKAEQLDDKLEKNPMEAKKVSKADDEEEDMEMMFDADEIEISFQDAATERAISEDLADIEPNVKVPLEPTLSEKDQEQFLLIQQARKRFDYQYFQEFAYQGPQASLLSQRDLEQQFETLSSEDKQLLIISMINSAYELNDIIPNIEMVFFRMFASPITTKAERKMNEAEDVLAGNLFQDDDFKMPKQAYISLLQSVALKPKKKHFKKILQYVITNKRPEDVPSDLINLITQIGIDQKYPVLLGHTMKFLLQNDYKVSQNTFQRFVMFLERCKGFEEDANRFLILSSETKDIQMSYKMVRPFFLRAMQYKTGQDVLKLFEQFRKNIKLNRSAKSWSDGERHSKLKELKKEFYDGLIRDLLQKEAYKLAQVIFSEKKRERFEITVNDQIIGLEIFSAQGKIDEYKEIFNELNREDSEIKLNKLMCEELGRTMLKFQSDAHKSEVLSMCDTLQHHIFDKNIPLSAKLFESLATQYTETQSWSKVQMLVNSVNHDNCDPSPRMVSYLKKNLVYCFDTNTRSSLKDTIDSFEIKFFSNEAREIRRQLKDNQTARDQMKFEKEAKKEGESSSTAATPVFAELQQSNNSQMQASL